MRSLPFSLERVTGIEPAASAWEAEVLPLDYTRDSIIIVRLFPSFVKSFHGFFNKKADGILLLRQLLSRKLFLIYSSIILCTIHSTQGMVAMDSREEVPTPCAE